MLDDAASTDKPAVEKGAAAKYILETNPWGYFSLLAGAVALMVFGVRLRAEIRAPEYVTAFTAVGAIVGLVFLTIVFFVLKDIQAKKNHKTDEAIFDDWEVEAVWYEWYEQVTRYFKEGGTSRDVDCKMSAKKFALDEALKLAETNPELNLKEWHEHMVTVFKSRESTVPEADRSAMRKVLDDLYSRYAL